MTASKKSFAAWNSLFTRQVWVEFETGMPGEPISGPVEHDAKTVERHPQTNNAAARAQLAENICSLLTLNASEEA
jgi:hypothetical protein